MPKNEFEERMDRLLEVEKLFLEVINTLADEDKGYRYFENSTIKRLLKWCKKNQPDLVEKIDGNW